MQTKVLNRVHVHVFTVGLHCICVGEPDNANSYILMHVYTKTMVITATKDHRSRSPSCEGHIGPS